MSHELHLAQAAVDAAISNGATYADARVSRVTREELCVRNGQMSSADSIEDFGIGVRALCDGAIGFAAAPLESLSDERAARALAARAVDVARALARVRRSPLDLGPPESRSGEYTTPCAID